MKTTLFEESIVLSKLIVLIHTPIKDFKAYHLGLINEYGQIKREPRSMEEKQAFTKLVQFAIYLKNRLERRVSYGKSDINKTRRFTIRRNDITMDNEIDKLADRLDDITEMTNDLLENLIVKPELEAQPLTEAENELYARMNDKQGLAERSSFKLDNIDTWGLEVGLGKRLERRAKGRLKDNANV